jgi:DNA (cytosine-5)-methyltransferase 1
VTLTVGSLFTGIGGLDLGLERAGMRVIWQSEIDPYACRILAKHWPDTPNHGDITQIDWSSIERADIICGGYPCQPFSTAGQRRGAEDPRHLWPHFRDAIRHLRPRYALMENVRGHLSLGGTTVLADLAAIGYDAEWRVISAASVGAPHRRERLFIVAYPTRSTGRIPQPHSLATVFGQAAELGERRSAARPSGDWWEVEPGMGRVADGVPARVDRLRALGNAVVPQIAELIGQLINNHERNNHATA